MRDLCGRCGTKHAKEKCPALEQKCGRCGNLNHYQSLCRTELVATVGEEDSDEDESYEICTIDEENKHSLIYLSARKSPEIKCDFKWIQVQNVTCCQ